MCVVHCLKRTSCSSRFCYVVIFSCKPIFVKSLLITETNDFLTVEKGIAEIMCSRAY